MRKLTKKQIVELAVDAVCVILCIVLLYAAISLIANRYVSWFGKLRLGVSSDSMSTREGQEPQEFSFDPEDLIVVEVLNESEVQELQKGDVVTYWGTVNGERAMVTHRIVKDVVKNSDGQVMAVSTRGDFDIRTDTADDIDVDEIIGKVVKVVKGGGTFNLWISSSTGRFIILVVPSLLIVVYVLIMFIMALKGRSKDKQAEDQDALRKQIEQELREKMLKEMADQQAKQEEHKGEETE